MASGWNRTNISETTTQRSTIELRLLIHKLWLAEAGLEPALSEHESNELPVTQPRQEILMLGLEGFEPSMLDPKSTALPAWL